MYDKTCSKCKVPKYYHDFHKSKCTRDGVVSLCKICAIAKTKQWAAKNHEYVRSNALKRYYERDRERLIQERKDKPKKVRILKTEEEKSATRKLYRLRNRANLIEKKRNDYIRTKESHLKKSKEWKMANPDVVRLHNKNRKAKKRGQNTIIKASDWRSRLDEFNNSCAYCFRSDMPLTMDHFYPISKGGSHTIDNVVPACQSCNSKKGDALIFDWICRFKKVA